MNDFHVEIRIWCRILCQEFDIWNQQNIKIRHNRSIMTDDFTLGKSIPSNPFTSMMCVWVFSVYLMDNFIKIYMNTLKIYLFTKYYLFIFCSSQWFVSFYTAALLHSALWFLFLFLWFFKSFFIILHHLY